MKQQSLFPQTKLESTPFVPEGLRYQSDFITETEERTLASDLAKLPLQPFEFHDYLANRRATSFGLRYDYSRREVDQAEEAPPFLNALRRKAAAFAGRAPSDLKQIGINEYRPGAGIGWHRDKPEFGDVIGISLLSSVRMRFRKRNDNGWLRASHILEPRSVYILAGDVREKWEHSIAPVTTLRYSLMFRTRAPEAFQLLAAG